MTFARDDRGRITQVRDPLGQTNGAPPVLKYVYDDETGNLVQVLRLTDRASASYTTNRYDYEDPRFPHFLTTLETAAGVARSFYDDAGRLIALVDALGQTNRFLHDLSNKLEQVIDRLNRTNSFLYDTRGNVIGITNVLGTSVQQVSQFGYDDVDNQIAATNALAVVTRVGYDTNNLPVTVTNAFGGSLQQVTTTSHETNGLPLTTTDARGYSVTNFYEETAAFVTEGRQAFSGCGF